MLIKKLIQRLLDSRTTPSEAGHNAMPSSSYITPTATAVQAWGQMAQGVAPFDGFVRASARASNTSSNIRVTNDTATVFVQSEGTATGQTQGVFVPVAKGDSWSVYGTNRDNPVVRVVKAIGGGGYNILLWRALSCLKPSFNFLLRSFSRVNGKQSKLGIFQKSETRLHSHQRQGKTLFTRLQRTDTFKSSCETARRVKNSPSLCTQKETKTAVQGRNSKILMDGFLYIYPFSRAKLSRFSAQELSQTLSLRSIRTTNPQTGGALC